MALESSEDVDQINDRPHRSPSSIESDSSIISQGLAAAIPAGHRSLPANTIRYDLQYFILQFHGCAAWNRDIRPHNPTIEGPALN